MFIHNTVKFMLGKVSLLFVVFFLNRYFDVKTTYYYLSDLTLIISIINVKV